MTPQVIKPQFFHSQSVDNYINSVKQHHGNHRAQIFDQDKWHILKVKVVAKFNAPETTTVTYGHYNILNNKKITTGVLRLYSDYKGDQGEQIKLKIRQVSFPGKQSDPLIGLIDSAIRLREFQARDNRKELT